jgi:hypothetical protein
MADAARRLQIKEAVERTRFGRTRAEILKIKGARCVYPGGDHEGDLVIDHIAGGGRHDTETGMMIPGKTHNLDNIRILCRKHAGLIDRMDFTKGIGRNTEGNSNNPSQ